MAHKFIRSLILLSSLFMITAGCLPAQPCADTQPVIAGSQVVTNNQSGVIYSTPNIPGHIYVWSLSGGSITSGQGTSQVAVLWGAVGTGSITVMETNPLVPCSTSVSKAISIQPLLISYFYYTNTSCYGDVVSFHDASINDIAFPITNYYWNFGDGTTSALQNPTHMYLQPYLTTWTVTLIVTNSIGYKDTIYDAVYVNPDQFIPTAAFSSTIPNCTYDPVLFDCSASTTPPGTTRIEQWDWNFGDGTPLVTIHQPNNPNVSHVFASPGTYNVSLKITNFTSCTNIVIHPVVITPSVPTAQYIFSSPSCLYNPVYFTNQSTSPAGHNIVSWEWNYGDGSPLEIINSPASPDVMHIFPGLGPYHVQLKAINGLGCADSIYKNVSLDPSPLTNFSWDSKCFGDTIKFENLTLQNNGPAIASYLWNFGDPGSLNNTSTLVNPTHVFSTTGTFSVSLQAVNTSGCPDTTVKQLTMFPPPTCDYTWVYGTINQQIIFHIDSSSTDWGAIGNMVIWNFGDGTYGYGWNPVHIYPTGGTYDVRLTVTDTIGCHGSVLHQIFVPALPMAFFSSNSPVCDSTLVCFTDLSNAATPPFGYITTWIWDFGDGTVDTILFPNTPNICHLYPNADTFAVTLKVFDNFGFNDSWTANVIVLPNPIANFFYSSTLCPDQLVSFTDASTANGGGNIISWSWNFDDPGSGPENTSNLINPTHIFTHGDSCYNVRLIVVNFNNCTDTMVKSVCIHPKPPVNFTYDTACLNQLVHFNADTVITHLDSIATWLWDFGDGSPTVTDPINTAHLYTTVGIYPVTLTITDIHGCTNFVIHTIQVNPLPVASFTWVAPACDSSAVQYQNQSYVSGIFSGYIVKWLWDFGDGTTQTVFLPASPDVTHIFVTGSLSHTVRLTVWTNDSCTSFIEHIVNTIPRPIANFNYSTVNCANQVVNFTDQSQTNGGGNIQWSWNFGDPGSGPGNFSNLQNPPHTFAASGTYYVKLTVTNVNTCFDTITKTIFINVKPVADFSADTACFGSPTTFTDLSIPNASAIISYLWDFGDGLPGNTQPNPVHTFPNYGLFQVTLSIVNSNGCTHSVTKQVLVNPLPTAAFNFSGPNCLGTPVCFTDQSTTPPGYLGHIVRWVWDFGDGTKDTIWFPANQNVCHTFAGALTHIVRLTVTTSDSCTHFIEHTVISVPSPIANFSYSTTNCAGQTVNFFDQTELNGGGPIISWNWNFGDPTSGIFNTSTLQNPQHTFATGNTFTVTLIINNLTNCPDTVVKTITINLLPVADFKADTACVGSLTTFTDLSTPNAASIISWSWNFGDGSAVNTLQNPVYTYSSYGVFPVTLTITNSNGCIHSVTKQVLVNPLPTAAFTFPTANCQGAPVCFVNTSTTPAGYLGKIVKWVWDFGDGSPPQPPIWFPANPDVCHVFPVTSSSYVVRLTVTTSDSCTHFVEHTINTIPSPVANFNWSSTTCANALVFFYDQSQMNGGGPIITWNWNFGDPLSGGTNYSTLQNPAHPFSASGNFTVTLIINNMSNCPDTIVKTVSVNLLPVADFNADTACVGNITTFTDLSVANAASISSWAWNFGDGSVINTQPNPTYTYSTYGLYNVTLTITNSNGCVHSVTKLVLVLPLPVAAFIYDTPTCMGAVVNYTDMSTTVPGFTGSIVKWVWDFGDGTTPTTIWFPNNADVSHVFAGTSQSHLVRLTVTTATPDSCTHFIEHTVNSIPSPQANFGFPATSCINQPVLFQDQSQMNGGGPLVTWNWNFGDPGSGWQNISNTQNPVHLFSGSGSFDVTLIVFNSSGCSDTIQKTIDVSAKPTAKFIADTVCKGSLTTFTDQSTVPAGSGTISAHFWEFGDGGTSTQTNPTYQYSAAGTYPVKLTVTTTKGCTKDTTINVIVHPLPTALFQFSSSACVGDSVQFTDLSTSNGAAIVRWKWEFGDGQTTIINYPVSPDVKHAYTSAATFNVTLTVYTSDSCSNSKTLPVTIQPKPQANFDYDPILCQMMPLQFHDLSQGTGGVPVVTWLWDFGDPGSGATNTSPLQNPSHSFSTSGSFIVLLTITNANGCLDSISKTIDINPAPVAQFTADTACVNSATQFTDTSIPGIGTISTWQWDFGDPGSGNNTSTQQNPTHIYSSPGTYNVTLLVTNSNFCERDTVIPINVNPAPIASFSYAASCVGDSTHFQDLSIAPGSQIIAWLWDFNDGGTSTLQNPNHAFMVSGTYNVKLKVTNLSGCMDSIVLQVVARPKPVASFIYTNFFCPAGQVMFQDQSHGVGASITDRHWIFEPGSESSLINPVHVFGVTNTTYPVMLIVTDNFGCTDTIVDTVFVKPGFSFSFTNDTVCFGFPMHFQPLNNAPGDSLYSTVWDFGDPTSGPFNKSLLYNPTHIFTSPGSYSVKLRVVNSDNCVDSVFRYVIVRALPAPAFQFTTPLCDSVIYFTDGSSAQNGTISTWIWNYGDGSPPDTIVAPGPGNTSHLYANIGSYSVILKVTNSYGCADTVSQVVQRYPCVLASFEYSDTLMCARYPIAFSDSSLPIDKITQWHWFFGDGTDTIYTSHTGNIVHTYADSGSYVVKLRIDALVNTSSFIDSLVRIVTIHPTPQTYFSNQGVCKNKITLFRDTSNTFGKGITTWNWNFGDPGSLANDTSTFKNPSHKYDTAGRYDVKLLVMNRWGCKDSLTKSTRVFALPVAHFDNTVACSGNPTNFTDNSITIDTTIMAWRWNFGELGSKKDTSELQDPVYRYQTEGDYLVRLVVMDHNGCLDTVDSTIRVNITPVSAFTLTNSLNGMTGKIQLNNLSTGATTYEWEFGNGSSSTDENPVATYTMDGTYVIMLISSNQFNCTDTTYYKYEVLFKGLYVPNAFSPTNSNLAVRLFKPVGINLKQYNIQVYDYMGHMLWQSSKLDTEGSPLEGWDGTFNGTLMPQGTYMWKASATFIDDTIWQGSDIGKGEYKTMGTVSLIR